MGKLLLHEEVKFVFESLSLPPNKKQWRDTVNTKVSFFLHSTTITADKSEIFPCSASYLHSTNTDTASFANELNENLKKKKEISLKVLLTGHLKQEEH